MARLYARRFYTAGVGGNVVLVVMYVVTRTIGVPWFGPAAGEIEPWSPLGVITKVFELALIGLLVWLARHPLEPGSAPGLLGAAAEHEDEPERGEPQEA